MLNTGLMFEILFWKLKKHMIFKFVAINRSLKALKILHNTITVKLQS